MKQAYFFATALTLALIGGTTTNANAQPQRVSCYAINWVGQPNWKQSRWYRVGKSEAFSDPEVDGEAFSDAIAEKMRFSVGYAAEIRNASGRRVVFDRRGWAISPCDRTFAHGERIFTLNTKVPIGSVSKMITTAAVLHAMRNTEHLGFISKLVDYLPDRWVVHDRFKNVTFSFLLQHRAGFRKGGSRPWTPSRLRVRLENGDAPNPPPVGSRKYSNTSMGVFHFIFKQMFHPGHAPHYDRPSFRGSDAEYDRQVVRYNGLGYFVYVRSQLFNPLSIEADCSFWRLSGQGKPVAFSYSSAADTTGEYTGDLREHCAAGGWVMSIKELLRFFYHFKYRRQMVTEQQYAVVENRTYPQNRLGWAMSSENFGDGWAFLQDGAIKNYRSVVVSLPNGYHAALLTNTREPSGQKLRRILRDAYNASRK